MANHHPVNKSVFDTNSIMQGGGIVCPASGEDCAVYCAVKQSCKLELSSYMSPVGNHGRTSHLGAYPDKSPATVNCRVSMGLSKGN